jgi:nitroreductase
MPILDLSTDELLTTTRAVRKRLDLTRPVEPEIIQQCLALALQAPTSGSGERWHFVIVTDPAQREALAALYHKGANSVGMEKKEEQAKAIAANKKEAATSIRSLDSARYLVEHLHEVPLHIIPCIQIQGRPEHLSVFEQSALWGTILPAVWSFMLAARSRSLGTVLTSLHLHFEQEAAEILNIPYKQIMQVGLIPVAYTLGTNFKPAARKPLEKVLHWNKW